MDQREQQIAFQRELNALVERFADEWDMTYVGMVGVLELQKMELANYLFSDEEDEDYE